MTTLEILTVEKIRSWWPCKDPVTEWKYIAEDWMGTILDILDMDIEHGHKLWCVRKLRILSIRASQEFAIFCAYQALSYPGEPDPRSIAALKVAELYLNGKIIKEEMEKATLMAEDAAQDASHATCTIRAARAARAIYYAVRAAYTAYYPYPDRNACAAAADADAAAPAGRLKQIAKLKELILETIK